MSGEVFLHVGFHKTATTYLQKNLFPVIDDVAFLGRHFEDINYGSSLYVTIMKFLCQPILDENLLVTCQLRLKDQLAKGSVLISDEWLTSNYDGFYYGCGANWREKIRRISLLVDCMECRVILVQRSIVDNAFSLYCEFKQIPYGNSHRDFFDFCSTSPEADALVNAYEYLHYLFGERLIAYSYECESPNFKSLSELLGGKKIADKVRLENVKVRAGDAILLRKRSKLLMRLRRLDILRKIYAIPVLHKFLQFIKPFILRLITRAEVVEVLSKEDTLKAFKLLEKRKVVL